MICIQYFCTMGDIKASLTLYDRWRNDVIRPTNQVILLMDKSMKTDRPGHVEHELTLSTYSVDRRICVVTTLQYYLKITCQFRTSNKSQLFLSVREPHISVSKDTIARWIRQMLAVSGIDVNQFNSVRAASVSAAKVLLGSTQDIMKKADWTQEKPFNKILYQTYVTNLLRAYDVVLLNERSPTSVPH